MLTPVTERSARISDCGRYRYDLVRRWGEGDLALWVMLNPSTADADVDDPTIRRVEGFSRREGKDGFVVVNLFALRSTDPNLLARVPADVAIGPDNDDVIGGWLAREHVGLVITAWGTHGSLYCRGLQLRDRVLAGRDVRCFGLTGNAQPKHPLYVRADAPLVSLDAAR